MKRIRIIGLALVAVFAFSAIAASAASAWVASPWEAFYSGKWHVVTTTIKVNSETKGLKLKNGGDEVECEGTDTGTIGANGVDEIITVTPKNPCKLIAHSGCKATQPKTLPIANAVNLPWKTQLEDEGELRRDKLTGHAGGGNPGYLVECENILGGKSKVECTAAEEFTNITNGAMDFLSEFAPVGEPAKCTGGISTKGAVIGVVTFTVVPGQFIEGEEITGVRADV